jgi:hypothetical protein
MGLGSGSKVWNPGTWIRCVLQFEDSTDIFISSKLYSFEFNVKG